LPEAKPKDFFVLAAGMVCQPEKIVAELVLHSVKHPLTSLFYKQKTKRLHYFFGRSKFRSFRDFGEIDFRPLLGKSEVIFSKSVLFRLGSKHRAAAGPLAV
jgi:hypothetical protein